MRGWQDVGSRAVGVRLASSLPQCRHRRRTHMRASNRWLPRATSVASQLGEGIKARFIGQYVHVAACRVMPEANLPRERRLTGFRPLWQRGWTAGHPP